MNNKSIIAAIAGVAIISGGIAASESLLERSWFASEKYVNAKIQPIAENQTVIQKQLLQTSEDVIGGQITASEIKSREFSQQLAKDPGNANLIELKLLTEDGLRSLKRRRSLIECDQLKLDRPNQVCP